VQAGEIKAKITADGSGFSSEIESAKSEIKEMAQAIVNAMRDIVRAENSAADARKKAAEEARRAAQEAEKAARQQEAAIKRLGITATLVFAGITKAIKDSISATVEYRNAMMGLGSVAAGAGEDLDEVRKAAEDLASDGLMPLSDAATGLKNLLATGFNLEQSITIMERLKDAAAFGRQGTLEFGEAVRTATEGIKNGNSILVDNAGVTKNLSVMLKEAGISANRLANAADDAQVRMAIFNGILRETRHQVGDAKRLADDLGGSLAGTSTSVNNLKVRLGEAISGPVSRFYSLIKTIVDKITDWIESHQVLAGAITLTAQALAGLVAAIAAVQLIRLTNQVTGLATAFVSLVKSPITWVIMGLLALAGIVGLVIKNWNTLKNATKHLGEAISEYFKQMWHNIKNWLEGVGRGTKAFWQMIKDIFTKGPQRAWQDFVANLQVIRVQTARNYKDMVWDATAFKNDMNKLWKDIKNQVSGFFEPLKLPEVQTGGRPRDEKGGGGDAQGDKANKAFQEALEGLEQYKAQLAEGIKGLTGEALTNELISMHQKIATWIKNNILNVKGLIKTEQERSRVQDMIFKEMLTRYERIAERDNWTTEQRLKNLDAYVTNYAKTLEALNEVDRIRIDLTRQLADEEARAKDEAYQKAMDIYQKETVGLKLTAEERKKIYQEVLAAHLPEAMRSAEAQKAIELQLLQFDREIANERIELAKQWAELEHQITVDRLRRIGAAKEAELADLAKWYADRQEEARGNEELLAEIQQAYIDKQKAIERRYYHEALAAQAEFDAKMLTAQGEYEEAALKQEEARWQKALAQENLSQDEIERINKEHELNVLNIKQEYANERLKIESEYQAKLASLIQTEREKELARNEQQEAEAIAAAKKVGADTTSITEYYRQERERINKKYNDQEKYNLATMQANLLELQGDFLQARLQREEAEWEKIKASGMYSQAELELAEKIHQEKIKQIKEEAAKEQLDIEAQVEIEYLKAKGNFIEAELKEEERRFQALKDSKKYNDEQLQKLEEIHQQKMQAIRDKYAPQYGTGFLARIVGGGFSTPEERKAWESGKDPNTGVNVSWMEQLSRAGTMLVEAIVMQVETIKTTIQAFLSGNWIGAIISIISQTRAFQRAMEVLNSFMGPIIALIDTILMPIIRFIANLWNAVIDGLSGINIFGWRPFAGVKRFRIDTDAWDEQDERDREGPQQSRKSGTQISEITGPTRDLLISLLSPLRNLDILPGLFDSMRTAIYEMRDAFLGYEIPVSPAPALVAAGGTGNTFVIEYMNVEVPDSASMRDVDEFLRLMGDRAQVVAKGRGA